MPVTRSRKQAPPPTPLRASSPEEIEAVLGEHLRALRLSRNIDQAGLAERAGVSLSALKALEMGRGSTLRTLVRVARALGREDWFDSIAPVTTVSPLQMLRAAQRRLRAGPRTSTSTPASSPSGKA